MDWKIGNRGSRSDGHGQDSMDRMHGYTASAIALTRLSLGPALWDTEHISLYGEGATCLLYSYTQSLQCFNRIITILSSRLHESSGLGTGCVRIGNLIVPVTQHPATTDPYR